VTREWIVLGDGGHAGVVIDALLLLGQSVAGYTSLAGTGRPILGVECLGDDDEVKNYGVEDVYLANGLGSTGSSDNRASLYQRFAARGFVFPHVVHPTAIVAQSVRIGAGTQVMAGAILQPKCQIGENVIINTRASVDHDCVIETDVHIAPGATVSGGVVIERGAHVGVGSSILQCCRIGSNSIVGAGAVVVRDVLSGITVVGVPAKRIGSTKKVNR